MNVSRLLPVVLGLGLIGAACGDGGGQEEVARQDLSGIVLQTAEAPAQTEHARDESGVDSLREFSVTGQESILEKGFVDGYAAVFVPKAGISSHYEVTSGALSFEDSGSAEAGLSVVVEDFRGRLEEPTAVPADGLGAESVGVEGPVETSGRPQSAVLYAWRVDNLVLFVSASALSESAPDPDVIRGLAETMNSRST